jgi:hypothetical protein
MHHRPPGNCNYAGVLIIWDRVFGTFVSESILARYSNAITQQSQIKAVDMTSDDISNVVANVSVADESKKVDLSGFAWPRGIIYGLAKPLNSFDPVYANFQHFMRISNPSDGHKGHYPLTMRLAKLSRFLFKSRVLHPFRVVLPHEDAFMSDITFQLNLLKGRKPLDRISMVWAMLVQLPPRSVYKVPAYPFTPGLTLPNNKDAEFYRSVLVRESPPLPWWKHGAVCFQFLLTLGAFYFLLLHEKKVQYGDSIAGWQLLAICCVLIVLLLQTVKLYYKWQ